MLIRSLQSVIVVIGLALSPSSSAQGLLFHKGSVLEFQFNTMTPASYIPELRPGRGFEGGFAFLQPSGAGVLRIELYELGVPSPFFKWDFSFSVPPPGVHPTFGYWDWGSEWGQKRGSGRLSYLSGSDMYLSFFGARQSLFEGGKLRAFEAILPVPEPSAIVPVWIVAVIGWYLSVRPSRPPNNAVE